MSVSGPIIMIDDDEDDQFLFRNILEELEIRNEPIFFKNGAEALHYLEETKDRPFLILCDVNMPVLNGLELKSRIDQSEYLKSKSIPFVFISTSGNPSAVKAAYEMTIQGFFKKETSYALLKQQIKLIVDYWHFCLHPNK
jgi:CheY-like chemotaxis protein